MNCPVCGQPTRVLDTRPADDGESIRRRRECENAECLQRFTTHERIEQRVLVLRKKDGRLQGFDAAKLRRGVVRACIKRPISAERIDRLVAEVEAELSASQRRPVPVGDVSTAVLSRLRDLDEVAYLRFASVNREFASAGEFLSEARQLERRD